MEDLIIFTGSATVGTFFYYNYLKHSRLYQSIKSAHRLRISELLQSIRTGTHKLPSFVAVQGKIACTNPLAVAGDMDTVLKAVVHEIETTDHSSVWRPQTQEW